MTGALLYAWRWISLIRARAKAQRTLANFVGDAQAQFDALVVQTIGTAAVALEWAVRAELVRDDIQDVREYVQQLAKRPEVRGALVATADGRVIAASDPLALGGSLAQVVTDPPSESAVVQMLERADGARTTQP